MTLRFWIRVNARLARDPDVQAFGLALMPKLAAWHSVRLACGLLLDLWGNVADERENGDLNGVPDGTLELWSGWCGKRGQFAKEFRARFIDEAGFIKEWQTYQGTLMERRADDRERKRLWREQQKNGKSGARPQDDPQDDERTSTRNVHGHPEYSAPNGAESTQGSPVALAPSGARPAPRVNGGVPGAPPLADDPDRARYSRRLVDRAEEEFSADPDLAYELEQEARKHFGKPAHKQLTDSEARIVRSEMHERLRVRLGLKSFDEWQDERRGAVA
jgi:hypothetical protein